MAAAETGTAGGSAVTELGAEHTGPPVPATPRVIEIGLRFGLPVDAPVLTRVGPAAVPLEPGRVVMLSGPSGSGKSSLLEAISVRHPRAVHVDRVSFSNDESIIDQIARERPLGDALTLLTRCGLTEPRLWIRRYAELSEGERFRARLAHASALAARQPSLSPLLCDEFCSTLHRRAASTISYNLRRLALQEGLCVVVATGHGDLATDLGPATEVHLSGQGRCAVTRHDVQRERPPSIRRRLRIVAGRKKDYEPFFSMHYRKTDDLGFVDKVFVLRDRSTSELLGIVVYSHSPLELALRNRATNGRFVRRPALLNARMRILRRIVIHPDLRGCGIGHWLVRRTLPRVGTQYVECLAGMGEVIPVFERAGMRRIGVCAVPPERRASLETLRAMGVDPLRQEFVERVVRQPRVRAVVARAVYQWYAGTTGRGVQRVARQSPETLALTFRGLIGLRPVYYLWHREGRKGKSVRG